MSLPRPDHHLASAAAADRAAHRLARLPCRRPPLPTLRLCCGIRPPGPLRFPEDPLKRSPGSCSKDVVNFQRRGRGRRRVHGSRDRVAHRLSKEVKAAAIYSSDLKRAAETAETIARICNLPNVVFDPALRERHIGDLQGMTLEAAAKDRREAYKAFLCHKRNQQIPGGGESLDQLSERCVSCLYDIVEKHKGEQVIVVSHGGTIRELYRHASPMKPLHGKIHNTPVSVIFVSGTTGPLHGKNGRRHQSPSGDRCPGKCLWWR